MSEIKPNEVYNTKEAQDFLKISKSTMKRYIKREIIKTKKVGGRYKILGKELLKIVSPEIETKAKRVYVGIRKKVKNKIKDW